MAKDTKKANKKTLSFIWVVIALVLILVLATFGFAATVILRTNDKQPLIVSISADEDDFDNNIFKQVIYRRVPVASGSAVTDTKGQWENNTTVDLFQNSYVNSEGYTSVESADGKKVIAPGTENAYTFQVKNTGNTKITYELILYGIFIADGKDIPTEFRFLKNGVYVLGTDAEWDDLEALKAYRDSDELGVNKKTEYTLEWRWRFESSDPSEDKKTQWDENDTQLGVDGENCTLSLTIQTIFEEVPGAVAVDENGDSLFELIFSAGDVALLLGAGALALGALAGILIILLGLNRTITISGILLPGTALSVKYKNHEERISAAGRFVMDKVRLRQCEFEFTDAMKRKFTWSAKLKSKKQDRAVAFEYTDQGMAMLLRNDIIVLELLFDRADEKANVITTNYAAFTKKNVLLTPMIEKEPDNEGENETPNGLHIDKKHRVSVR